MFSCDTRIVHVCERGVRNSKTISAPLRQCLISRYNGQINAYQVVSATHHSDKLIRMRT